MTGPRSWLHTAVHDHLTATLTVPVYDQQPATAPPDSRPEYVVLHPWAGQTGRGYLHTAATDLLWPVTIVIAGMTRRAVLHHLDAVAAALDGWCPHPTDPTYPAFRQHTEGGEVLAEGITGWRPYSTSVTYAIDTHPQEHP